MGAMTISASYPVKHGVDANRRWIEAVFEFSSSYATGGDSIPMDEIPLTHVQEVWADALSQSAVSSGDSVAADVSDTTAPLVLLYTGSATEETATTDRSGTAVKLRLFGTA